MAELTDDIIIDLVYRSLGEPLEGKDADMLNLWLSASGTRQAWYAELRDTEKLNDYLHYDDAVIRAAMMKRIEMANIVNYSSIKPVHRVHFLKTAWFRYAAAIIIIFATGAYFWNTTNKSRTITHTQPVSSQNDMMPGGNRATLTLADGSVITLDSAASGQLAQQPGATITKAGNGEIIYSFDQSKPAGSISFNTMSTPRGGQYQLVLPDGSKVWLNAESSITFPTVFNGNNREVKIKGEAYFEIKKNKEKPFIVNTNKDIITVLGTSFNINAYPEEIIKTSLVEGSVKVNDIQLKPGQAYFNEKIITTDIQRDIAWKNGVFNFEDMSLEQAMRQLARWYDVQVIYQGAKREVEFGGRVSRSLSLLQVIDGLEGIEQLHFELRGKILTVFL